MGWQMKEEPLTRWISNAIPRVKVRVEATAHTHTHLQTILEICFFFASESIVPWVNQRGPYSMTWTPFELKKKRFFSESTPTSIECNRKFHEILLIESERTAKSNGVLAHCAHIISNYYVDAGRWKCALTSITTSTCLNPLLCRWHI